MKLEDDPKVALIRCSECKKPFYKWAKTKMSYRRRLKFKVRGYNCITCSKNCSRKRANRLVKSHDTHRKNKCRCGSYKQIKSKRGLGCFWSSNYGLSYSKVKNGI